MKNIISFLGAFALMTIALVMFSNPVTAQQNYKHPYVNSSGHVFDSTGTKLGWVKNGVVYNGMGEKVGRVENQDLVDYKGHKLGTIGSDGTFYDEKGVIVFTVEAKSKGEQCQVFDPDGNVIATVHENYKNQACAIHCLSKKMKSH